MLKQFLTISMVFSLAWIQVACSSPEVPVEVPVEVTREVPVEVTREVPVEVTREVPVEVTREVPVEIVREVEVIREVPVTVIAQPTLPPIAARQSWSGVGDEVILCRLSSGSNILEFSHTGQGHFAVWIHDDEGYRDLLANESGRYEGTNFVRGGSNYGELVPGLCILEITADGRWTAEIRDRP